MTADAALVWADKVLNLRRTPSPDESMESYHAALMENCITALAAEVRALRQRHAEAQAEVDRLCAITSPCPTCGADARVVTLAVNGMCLHCSVKEHR